MSLEEVRGSVKAKIVVRSTTVASLFWDPSYTRRFNVPPVVANFVLMRVVPKIVCEMYIDGVVQAAEITVRKTGTELFEE